MRKKRLIRLQMFLLAVLIGLVIWRSGADTDRPDGVVVFSDLKEGRLYRTGLQVDEATDLAVTMTVAFETDESDAPLAVYGWILDNRNGTVIWTVNPAAVVRDGVLALVADTIHVAAGAYEVFLTTYGPTTRSRRDAPFLGLKPFWTNYRSEWNMSISEAGVQDGQPASVYLVDSHDRSADVENLVWTTGPVGDHAVKSHVFRVVSESDLTIYSVGEICTSGCDYGWIEDVLTGDRIWEMDWENTESAGGMEKNRSFSGDLRLEPGIYRAVFTSNGGHSANHWDANPPHDPDGWGLTMTGTDPTHFPAVDPWSQSTPIISMTDIRDDDYREQQFSLSSPAVLLVFAMGEISSDGTLYDYAWIENNSTLETTWEMSRKKSRHAGGDNTNRQETAFLELAAGRYTIFYRSDESHGPERWRKSAPQNPDRWGVTVFPMDPDTFDSATFSLVQSAGEASDAQVDASIGAGEDSGARLDDPIAGFVAVGNDADPSQPFELTEDQSLRIIAAGELSSGGRYDYGWIENAESGEIVWEMNVNNTKYAGGEDRNRRFDGIISLPAGAYILRYITDFSHAYGDFGEGAPSIPREWGIRIFGVTR